MVIHAHHVDSSVNYVLALIIVLNANRDTWLKSVQAHIASHVQLDVKHVRIPHVQNVFIIIDLLIMYVYQ
jgi:hypothetical protein